MADSGGDFQFGENFSGFVDESFSAVEVIEVFYFDSLGVVGSGDIKRSLKESFIVIVLERVREGVNCFVLFNSELAVHVVFGGKSFGNDSAV